MKKSTKAVIALSAVMSCSSAFAGGVEVPPPNMWDFYIGASGVAYGHENRINSTVLFTVPMIGFDHTIPTFPYDPITQFRNIGVFGGFDMGIGVWADRGYFGVEGRYDIATLSAAHMLNGAIQTGITVLPTLIQTRSLTQQCVYSAKLTHNAAFVAKIGYQLLPRTMLYMIAGWVTTHYQLSLRTFGPGMWGIVDLPFFGRIRPGTVEREGITPLVVYSKRLNGGTMGIGFSHLLVDSLSTFAEFSFSGYHIPTERKWMSTINVGAVLLEYGATGNTTSWNYYNWNLRVGLNWSFVSLF